MKLIGVSPRFLIEDGVEKQFVNTRYIKQLTKRGFNVIMLTTDNPDPKEILKLCDGFLITGGADIDPKYFNEENKGESRNCNSSLDSIDKTIVDYAVENKLPLLGICRGHQALNIFLGGSLYQDIGNAHTNIKSGQVVHTVKNQMLNLKESFEVNSYHHQTLKDVAFGLEVIAKAEDGTIEAIIHQTLPMIGIQWHPEIIPDTEESNEIFNKFASLINENKKIEG